MIIGEEIFSNSIEFEPAWIGKIVLDGYVMRSESLDNGEGMAGKTRRT